MMWVRLLIFLILIVYFPQPVTGEVYFIVNKNVMHSNANITCGYQSAATVAKQCRPRNLAGMVVSGDKYNEQYIWIDYPGGCITDCPALGLNTSVKGEMTFECVQCSNTIPVLCQARDASATMGIDFVTIDNTIQLNKMCSLDWIKHDRNDFLVTLTLMTFQNAMLYCVRSWGATPMNLVYAMDNTSFLHLPAAVPCYWISVRVPSDPTHPCCLLPNGTIVRREEDKLAGTICQRLHKTTSQITSKTSSKTTSQTPAQKPSQTPSETTSQLTIPMLTSTLGNVANSPQTTTKGTKPSTKTQSATIAPFTTTETKTTKATLSTTSMKTPSFTPPITSTPTTRQSSEDGSTDMTSKTSTTLPASAETTSSTCTQSIQMPLNDVPTSTLHSAAKSKEKPSGVFIHDPTFDGHIGTTASILRALHAQNILVCTRACMKHSDCLAVFFFRDSNLCQLIKDTSSGFSTSAGVGSEYYIKQ